MIRIITLILLFSFASLFSCSRVFWNDESQKIVIRSMDLNRNDYAKIVIFPRGYSRDGGVDHSLNWVSKYGSVITTAFNIGTVDGLNEAGLAAHLHYLEGAEYPCSQGLPKIGIHHWVQYFLDSCSNVKEAVEAAKKIQIVDMKIAGEFWPLYVILEDPSGESAVLQYLRGELMIHQGYNLNVATNDPSYTFHLENLKNYVPFGGILPLPKNQTSEGRFIRLSACLETIGKNPQKSWSELFQIIIKDKKASWQTHWLSIIDLKQHTYSFIRVSDNKTWLIDLNKIDFSQGTKIIELF